MAFGDVPTGINNRWALFDDAPTLVKKRFDDMQQTAMNGFNMAMAAIQGLANIGQQLELINKVIAIDTTVINEPNLPDRTPPSIDMDQLRVDVPATPIEPTLIDATLETIPSSFPEMIGPGDANPGDLVYVSPLLTALKSKILSDLVTGSTGLTDAVEDAIFKREYERSLLEHENEKDRIAANWATGNFPFPNSGLRAALDKADREFSNKRLDVSRDVAIKSFELALQNSHFVIQQGVVIEGLLIQWSNQVATRVLEASKAEINKLIQSYEAKVKGFSERTRLIIEKCLAKIQYNIGVIRMYEGSVNAFSAKMRAESDRVNAVSRGYEAEANLFNTQVNFDIQRVNLDLKVIQARIDQAVANAGIMIKDKEVELKNYELIKSLMMEAQKAIGMIAAQVASGALSAVHAAVGISASDSASYSYSPTQASTTSVTTTDAEGNQTTTVTQQT